MTVGGSVAVLVAGGAGLGISYSLVTGDGEALGRFVAAIVPYLAPVLALGAVASLLHGVAPRATFLAWALLAFCVVVMAFGELLRLPDAVLDLSPFMHIALAPAEEVRWLPVAVISLVAVTFSVVGQLAFRWRDVVTP
jgi:ABC-2 type transport system permease protein